MLGDGGGRMRGFAASCMASVGKCVTAPCNRCFKVNKPMTRSENTPRGNQA